MHALVVSNALTRSASAACLATPGCPEALGQAAKDLAEGAGQAARDVDRAVDAAVIGLCGTLLGTFGDAGAPPIPQGKPANDNDGSNRCYLVTEAPVIGMGFNSLKQCIYVCNNGVPGLRVVPVGTPCPEYF